MSARSRVIPRTFSIVLAACLWAASAAAAQARAIAPLPPSEYGVRQLCGGPAPGRAACLALRLVPETPTAQARTQPLGAAAPAAGPLPAGASSGAFGLRPQDLHNAYSLPTTAVGEQTIAIVDAYNDPRA